VRLEQLHHLGEVSQAAGEPVDLVDDDRVEEPGLDVRHQRLEPGPLHRSTREPAIVIGPRKELPAFVLLSQDERLAGLPLGMKRVERLFEPLIARLAGINSAADDLGVSA
jgi:hypothetical protein